MLDLSGLAPVLVALFGIAVGAALTAQVKGLPHIALTLFGEGATNIGAFHEALNARHNVPSMSAIKAKDNFIFLHTAVRYASVDSEILKRIGIVIPSPRFWYFINWQ